MKLDLIDDERDNRPVVRLYEFVHTATVVLLGAVTSLADGECESVALHELPGIERPAACQLFLRVGLRDVGMVQIPGSKSFECVLTNEAWADVAGLIAPFVDGAAGYQWLVTSGDGAWLLSADGNW